MSDHEHDSILSILCAFTLGHVCKECIDERFRVWRVARRSRPKGGAMGACDGLCGGMCQNVDHVKIWTRIALDWPLSGRHAIWKRRLGIVKHANRRSIDRTLCTARCPHLALLASVPPACDRWSFHTPHYFLESRSNVLARWRDRWCMMDMGRVLLVGAKKAEECKYRIRFIGWKILYKTVLFEPFWRRLSCSELEGELLVVDLGRTSRWSPLKRSWATGWVRRKLYEWRPTGFNCGFTFFQIRYLADYFTHLFRHRSLRPHARISPTFQRRKEIRLDELLEQEKGYSYGT